MSEQAKAPMQPTYFVRHPDGSISIATPQPSQDDIAKQLASYALCDGKHGGSCCEDPDCHLMPIWRIRRCATELLEALQRLSAQAERLRLPGQPQSDAEKNANAAISRALGQSKGE